MRNLIVAVVGVCFLHACAQECRPDPSEPMLTAPVPGKAGLEAVMTQEIWDELFKGISTPAAGTCTGGPAYFSFNNLVEAARAFPQFANSGNFDTDRREVAAFLAHASHETNGGWATAPCGQFAWGLCFNEEVACKDAPCSQYTHPSQNCLNDPNYGIPCPPAPGKYYHGRGAIQLSHNYNYALYSSEVYGDDRVLKDPDMVLADGVEAWKAALWFWLRPQSPKPSCHDVMTNQYAESADMQAVGWVSGFGMTINIINGGLECGCRVTSGPSMKPHVRVGYYDRYSKIMGVHMCAEPSDTVWCDHMPTFTSYPGGCTSGQVVTTECASATGGGGGNNPSPTNPPPTNPPPTNPPVTNPPVTNPPVTNPPQTNPPQTNPPPAVTNPPTNPPPATGPPTDPAPPSEDAGCYYNKEGVWWHANCMEPSLCLFASDIASAAECQASGLTAAVWADDEMHCRNSKFAAGGCSTAPTDPEVEVPDEKPDGEPGCFVSSSWWESDCNSASVCIFDGKYSTEDLCINSGAPLPRWAVDEAECRDSLKGSGCPA